MSHFRLHTKIKGRVWRNYLLVGLACLMVTGLAGYAAHSFGTVRAKSRELVMIHTEEEFVQYLLDQESEEYNLNGRYRLEENLDLKGLESSVGSNIEPFTGSLNGNGHVIYGLERPLFGVMEKAEIENLFLGEAEIRYPFTYYDGEHYVDGYGALAAYAVNSVIRNCGMGGEIYTASPSEVAYQVAKASPPDALEEKGPGAVSGESAGEVQDESENGASAAGGAEKGPGVDAGPEEEAGINESTNTGPGTEEGPGTESGMNGGVESENSTGPGTETETAGDPGTETGTAGDQGTETGTGEASGTENGTGEVPGNETEVTGEPGPGTGTDEDSETESGTSESPDKETMETGDVSETEAETGSESGTESDGREDHESSKASSETGGGTGLEAGSQTGEKSDPKTTGSSDASNKQEASDAADSVIHETVGYQANDRHYLMLKVSPVTDVGPGALDSANPVSVASPSEATPAEVEEIIPSSDTSEVVPIPEEPGEPEYIGNPDGDSYILVIAERITAGGLIGETAGETLISDSFVLVTMRSELVAAESYTGGLAGILGENTRAENSYTAGLMEHTGITGGFAAVNRGTIQNCYSTVTVGPEGTVRSAFVASGAGHLSGCVYDRQMASVTEETGEEYEVGRASSAEADGDEKDPEFALKGLDIVEMTGMESQVPGSWYLAEQAYPQIEYFAGSEDETISSYSKASVISLPLSPGTTLLELREGSDILLPSEVDGQSIQWNGKGGVSIDENNQAKIDSGKVSVSPNDVPVVGTALDVEMGENEESDIDGNNATDVEMTAVDGTTVEGTVPEEAVTEEIPEETATKETDVTNDTMTSGVIFEATVGNTTRTILGNTSTAAVPANWTEVGTARYNNNQPARGSGTVDDPYLLGSPEDLAWFMVYVNNGNYSACGTLTADIDMTGSNYSSAYSKNSPMQWGIMAIGSHGSTNGAYSGTFDGQFHTISSLAYEGRAVQIGFIGVLAGVVQNLYLDNVHITSTSANGIYLCVGGIAGQTVSGGRVQRCGILSGILKVNNRSGTRFITVGGIVGDVRNQPIIDCFNWATIENGQLTSTIGNLAAGIGGRGPIANNCYNIGKITGDVCAVDGIALSGTIKNSYSEEGTTATIMGKSITKENLQSWIACYALNGQSKNGPWKYNEGAYPDFGKPADKFPGTLPALDNWASVGKGMETGLLTAEPLSADEDGSSTNPYHIKSAEQLAQFAYKVNQGAPSLCAELTADISLFGSSYTGESDSGSDEDIASRALQWIPIGSDVDGKRYTGNFNGNGHVISKMKLSGTEKQGLFGTLGDAAQITKTGISTVRADVSNYAGGIAGYASGSNIKITGCGNLGSFTGTGNYFGGCVGGTSSGTAGMVLDGCYNGAGGIISTSGSYAGGILGGAGANQITILNCYNRGKVSGTKNVGGITGLAGQAVFSSYNAGTVSGTGSTGGIAGGISDAGTMVLCYYESGTTSDSRASVKAVEQAQLKTWGMAWMLNSRKLNQGGEIFWDYDPEKNDGYPYPTSGTPNGAREWDDVMEGAANGFVIVKKPMGSPYQIRTAEHLAWFAYEASHTNAGLSAVLSADIDMTDGESPYITGGRLSWTPIGTEGSPYAGTFESKNTADASDTGTIYRIQNLYTGTAGISGLFGTVSGGTISRIGLVNADITATGENGGTAGGIAGQLVEGTITRCYHRKEGAGISRVTASGTASGGFSGGIAGRVNGSGTIVDCYNLDTQITATGPGARAGGITGGLSADGNIRNCYNAVESGGKLDVPADGKVGSIAGQAMAAGKILRCWRDKTYATDQTGISDFGIVSGTNRQDQTNALNTLEGSGERLGASRVWYTSLLSEATRGLPTFEEPVFVSVTLPPADSVDGTTASLSQAVPAALYRGIREEQPGDTAALPLAKKTDMVNGYYTFGTESANQKLALETGAGADISLLPYSLTEPGAPTGVISTLTLFTAGAYTYEKDRVILLDVASSGVRYEIRATIPGASSKTLSVVLPVKVGIEDLTPDGNRKTSYSADLTLTNNNDYPIAGNALRLIPMAGDGYVTLKPVAKTDPYGSTKQLADPAGGVKVGIADTTAGGGVIPAEKIYYTPANDAVTPPVAEKWMEYQIKGKGVLPYRYFIEYEANPYYSDTNKYGYTVSYQFGISKDDMPAGRTVVAK